MAIPLEGLKHIYRTDRNSYYLWAVGGGGPISLFYSLLDSAYRLDERAPFNQPLSRVRIRENLAARDCLVFMHCLGGQEPAVSTALLLVVWLKLKE